jgi:hypothetical protein
MQTQKDKLILSTEDYPELKDYFSTMEPGDKCAFKGTASLDENGEGTVILSVDDITFPKNKAGKTGEKDAADESVASKLYKGRKATEETDTNDEEDGTAPEAGTEA